LSYTQVHTYIVKNKVQILLVRTFCLWSTLTLLNQQLCTCNFTNSIYHVEIINLSFVKGNITLGDIRKNDIWRFHEISVFQGTWISMTTIWKCRLCLQWQPEPLNRNESGRFGALKSDSTHHFFRIACTKSGSLRFSQFSGCWLILSVYIIMSFDFPFVRLFGVR
jgi:hypothetical protein